MKSINQYITEKLFIKNKTYNYFPETKEELKEIINKRIKEEGKEVDLNDIDTSEITDMSNLFEVTNFNGDISDWDVSNVTNMSCMFLGCDNFNQDISNWNVSNVTDMRYMFYRCKKFNKPLNNWNVSNVIYMHWMFGECNSFNQDISNWDVSKVDYNSNMLFYNCPIEEKYKPKFS